MKVFNIQFLYRSLNSLSTNYKSIHENGFPLLEYSGACSIALTHHSDTVKLVCTHDYMYIQVVNSIFKQC